jgi:predicted nucleic acid-binding Zn ribbon protein
MKDEPLKACPKCGKDLRRLINGGNGVIFKGGGFYVTDKNAKSESACQSCPANSGSKSSGDSGAACPKAVNS